MKIVFLSDDFPPQSFGGAGISTYELARGMQRAGHKVFVITTCRDAADAKTLVYDGLTIHRIASNYHPRWRFYRNLWNVPAVRKVAVLLKEIRPDVVHANNIHYYLSYRCLKVAKRYAPAVVFTARDHMLFNFGKLETRQYLETFNPRTTWRDHLRQAGKRYNPLYTFFVRRYLRYVDRIFAISNALRDAMEQNGIKPVSVIHNGIEADEWKIEQTAVQHFREKHNLVNKRILLFSGRLSSSKGGAKVIEALRSIVREVPDAVLLVVGTIDEYARSMQRYADASGVGAHLIFSGWINRNEIKYAYGVADVVLMPSIYLEPFGRISIEAMAAGKPVVGTCFGGTPEVVEDGVTGYIVNPLHPEEIAVKTIDLLKNSEKAVQFGKAGHARLLERFSLEEKVREYIMAYESVIEEEGRL